MGSQQLSAYLDAGEEEQQEGAAKLLEPAFLQPLTDAAGAMCDAIVREATGGSGARSLASRELVRALLPLAVRVQHLCVLGTCLLGDRFGAQSDPDGELVAAIVSPFCVLPMLRLP